MYEEHVIARDPHDAKIIVFDGVCVLCNRWVAFVLKHDRREEFKFAAMQSDSGRALLAKYGLDPEDPASFLLLEEGRAFTDSDAIARLLDHFRWPWRLLARSLRLIPRSVRDAAYRCIARNRYRVFGRFDTCSVPAHYVRHRFLS